MASVRRSWISCSTMMISIVGGGLVCDMLEVGGFWDGRLREGFFFFFGRWGACFMAIRNTMAYADELDRQEPLAHMRDRFVIDDPDLIYLDGNSLGRLPKATTELVREI